MNDEVDDLLMGGGLGPAVKFDRVGDSATLVVTGPGQKYRVIDYTTKQPKNFPSGDPIFAVKYPVAPEGADKQHTLFVEKKELRVAIANAVRAAGATGLKPGDTLWIQRGKDGTPKNDRTHTFAAKFKAADEASRKRAQEIAASAGDDDGDDSGSTDSGSDPWATTQTSGNPPF